MDPVSNFLMKLISLQDQTVDGSRHLKTGEEFEMSEASARFLIATKRAKPKESDESKEPKRYNRRDMRAAD